jgi:hypothetical protein
MYLLCLFWTIQSILGIGYGRLNKLMFASIEIAIALGLMLTSQFMMSLQIGLILNRIEKRIPKN